MSPPRPVTYDEVAEAYAQLRSQGHDITAPAIRVVLGRGVLRTITRHLNTIKRTTLPVPRASLTAGGLPAPAAAGPWGITKYEAKRAVGEVRTPDDPETVALNAWVAARKAEGYGVVQEPVIPTYHDDEDDVNKEAKRRLKTLRLVRSLLQEAVPWLHTHETR